VRHSLWFLVAGAIFVVMALAGSLLRRLPLSSAMLYLAIGVALGPYGAGAITLDAVRHSQLVERVTEVGVLVSLFAAGLKLRTPWLDGRWLVPVRLASLSMMITVALVAAAGVLWLGLTVGAAVLLGSILAPTDPVLASDVQVEHATDQDRLRFALTGEAGLNDGSAFPFVLLGLGLLGMHELGPSGLRWVMVDVIWAVAGGLGIGALLGTAVGRTVVYLRRAHREAVGLDDFLALGLIGLSYGLALLAHAYGFLAVFASGLALRRIERLASGVDAAPEVVQGEVDVEDPATDEATAPAYMARAILGFNERLERIAEVGLVLLVGSLFPLGTLPADALWFVPLLFLVIRPLAVWAAIPGRSVWRLRRRLIAWFGVRGVGSLYYLAYAIQQGVVPGLAERLAGLTLTVIAVSVLVHGVSVTPLMNLYGRRVRVGAARLV
jgi:sodium/hydrogen antiporter